ncbi:MAG: hypothetical protein II713_04435, partial [Clostridia bacterium]|nr:hypothetical protein [Clostridia bacterium]
YNFHIRLYNKNTLKFKCSGGRIRKLFVPEHGKSGGEAGVSAGPENPPFSEDLVDSCFKWFLWIGRPFWRLTGKGLQNNHRKTVGERLLIRQRMASCICGFYRFLFRAERRHCE